MAYDPWPLLGIAPTRDPIAIRKAYARQLKSTRPDDDAQAYQNLRWAFDVTLHWARTAALEEEEDGEEDAVVVAPERVDVAEQTAQPAAQPALAPVHFHDASPDVASAYPGASPPVRDIGRELAALLADARGAGTRRLDAAWPAIARGLDELPLAWRDEASGRFAEFVAQTVGLPTAALTAMAAYFGWGRDYRSDAALGKPLAARVLERLREAGARRVTDATLLRRFAVPFRTDRLLDEGRDQLALIYAALAPPKYGDRLRASPPELLRTLGLGASMEGAPGIKGKLHGIFVSASALRLVALSVVMAVLFYCAGRDGAIVMWLGLLASIGAAVVAYGTRELQRLLDAGLHRFTPGKSLRKFGVVAALTAGFVLPFAWPESAAASALIASTAALLIAWDVQVAWRGGLVLAWTACTASLNGMLGIDQLHWSIAGGLAWTLVMNEGGLNSLPNVMANYRHPWRMLPHSAWGWLKLLLFGYFLMLPLLAVAIITLPLTYLAISRLFGLAFASAALVLGIVGMLLLPEVSEGLAIAGFLLAPLLLVLLQGAATALSRTRIFLTRS